ncbi:MAG: hypothetical protein IPK72_21015 [Candidatus Eisenbacteria bacterium]|nr:hypothetical protein [Candidatus Eisenbacteria bacterium]
MVTADVDLLRLLETRDRELEELSKTVEKLREDNELLGERLKTLLNALYGRKSERIAPGQLDLFTKLPAAAEVAPEPAPSRILRSKGAGSEAAVAQGTWSQRLPRASTSPGDRARPSRGRAHLS